MRSKSSPRVIRSASCDGRDLGNRTLRRGVRSRSLTHAAELLVVDELRDLVRAARGALRILAQVERAKAHAQRIHEQQPSGEALSDSEDELERLGRLNRADDSRQHAEHAALGAARNESRRWRLAEETAIARRICGREHRCLSLEAIDAAVHVRLAEQHARVVHEIARLEVVGAVDDDVVRPDDLERVARCERRLVRLDLDVRIEILDAVARRVELALADRARAVKHLALQVRGIHDIEVHEAERADAGRGEIERGGRAEPAHTNEQHARALELLLSLEPDFGKNEVTAVAEDLFVRELRRHGCGRRHRISLRQWRARW